MVEKLLGFRKIVGAQVEGNKELLKRDDWNI
jgi:hypothetical protein